jgi:hypothetical protein
MARRAVFGAGHAGGGGHGVRYRLHRTAAQGDARWTYRGELELPEGRVAIRIDVHAAPQAADGIDTRVEVEASALWQRLSEARRTVLGRTAANMVKVAVRRADGEGVDPPRRIQRWRA